MSSMPGLPSSSLSSSISSSTSDNGKAAALARARETRWLDTFDLENLGLYNHADIFLVFDHPLFDVGWKLHVAKPAVIDMANPYTLPADYRTLLVYLVQERVPHKIVRNWEVLAWEEERHPGQRGKFITIYPNDNQQMLHLADVIELMTLSGTPPPPSARLLQRTAPGDLSVGGSGNLGARWGGLTGKKAINQGNKQVPDDRTRPMPPWLKNPFLPNSLGVDKWYNFPKDDNDYKAKLLQEQELWPTS